MKHPAPSGPPPSAEAALATPEQMRQRLREAGRLGAQREAVRTVLAAHRGEEGSLLPILHDVQDRLGCVPGGVVPDIAEGLNLSRAEVHGVVSYYHHFRTEPAGRHVLQVCRAESCQAMGSEALWHSACEHLGLDAQGGTAGDAVTLEPVYCLGLCALSPAVALDERPLARMTAQRLGGLLDKALAEVAA
ncbi:MAG: formate dehydrogenase subunit gamma [Pseudomonadota bacterium]